MTSSSGRCTALVDRRRKAARNRDPLWIHIERKKPGVTLELLHLEYLAAHPGGYSYAVFCDTYRAWLKRKKLTMRQTHRAGDKL